MQQIKDEGINKHRFKLLENVSLFLCLQKKIQTWLWRRGCSQGAKGRLERKGAEGGEEPWEILKVDAYGE